MIPRIKNIVSVNPYSVTCLWNTGEIRTIDFSDWITESELKPNSVINKLKNEDVFKAVKVDTEMQTLYWENLLQGKDSKGNSFLSNLDFCPDVLYRKSKLKH